MHTYCANCSADLVGEYCHRCGAPELGGRDLTLKHFLSDMAAEVTDLQRSKLMRTFWTLCFRPGLLTLENFTGRRIRYLKPITLVLAVFALHLAAFTASESVPGFDLRTVMKAPPGAPPDNAQVRMRQSLEQRASKAGMSTDALIDTINAKWVRNFSLFQIPLILFLALWVHLIVFFSRRHFVQHAVFAMHLIAFTGLTVVLMWPLYYMGVSDLPLFMAKFFFDLIWVGFAVRRVYSYRTSVAFVLAFFIHGGYGVAFQAAILVALRLAMPT